MSSIFRKDDNYVDKPKRNTFDLSHQVNLTTNFGRLTPVLVQPVLPGDSVRIKPTFGLRAMPQVFPVQTRQRASIKYYYVRNRNLWKDWMDFIGKTKSDLVPPYIKFSKSKCNPFYYLSPSKTADYVGVPIKVEVPYGSTTRLKLADVDSNQGIDNTLIPNSDIVLSNYTHEPFAILSKKNIVKQVIIPSNLLEENFLLTDIYGAREGLSNSEDFKVPLFSKVPPSSSGYTTYTSVGFALFRRAWKVTLGSKIVVSNVSTGNTVSFKLIVRSTDGFDYALSIPYSGAGQYGFDATGKVDFRVKYFDIAESTINERNIKIDRVIGVMYYSTSELSNPNAVRVDLQDIGVLPSENPGLCWSDIALSEIPFCSTENPDGIRLSALPFRAIESVYNALIRNAENNPFMINGVPEYNKYLKSVDGGEEQYATDIMNIHSCNWADDRFTTALPSPQQGNAPLVGLTGVNGATVNLASEDGTRSTVHLQVDTDTGNVVMVDGVSSESPEYLNDAFMSAVEYGITINDLRNVNSFQRWLENNIRRGYKYKDQLMAHYGVNARFDVLDMPEFIGGVSRDVSVNQITQTVENEYGNLGEYGGQSYVMGEGQSIEHYCDEHGFIIGLMSVYPMPLYQDTLPKFLEVNNAFDYYFPEFGKIGMQPILNKELAFSQSFFANEMDGVFGYQRAWYDYLEKLDSVHGNLRFDLRNYILGRDFGTMPKLNGDFLTVQSDDLNNTFYSDDDNDKFIGQIYHDMSMKRPIPLIGIPALE